MVDKDDIYDIIGHTRKKAGSTTMNLEILTNESKERLQTAILAHMKIGFVLLGPVQVGLTPDGVIYVATLLRELDTLP